MVPAATKEMSTAKETPGWLWAASGLQLFPPPNVPGVIAFVAKLEGPSIKRSSGSCVETCATDALRAEGGVVTFSTAMNNAEFGLIEPVATVTVSVRLASANAAVAVTALLLLSAGGIHSRTVGTAGIDHPSAGRTIRIDPPCSTPPDTLNEAVTVDSVPG